MHPKPTLAIDLGGTKLLLALVDGATILDRVEAQTDRAAGPQAWVSQMAELARPWTARFENAGIAVTGLVHDNHWQALNPRTLAIPDRFALHAAVQKALCVPVTLCNDAQAAAWGEHLHGAGQRKDIAFVTVSTGVGGGIVCGGRLLAGRGGLAGHFGQLLPLPEGSESRFEDGASGHWIAAQGANIQLDRDARAVFAAAANGLPAAEQILQTAARRIARLCHNLQLLLAPDVIIIGGGVGLASGFLARIKANLAHLDPLVRPTLVQATLGKDAGVIGVADLSKRNQPQLRG